MRDPEETTVHTLRGHPATGVNWRPIHFTKALPQQLVCGLCRVVPERTVLLPCSHTLCEACHEGAFEDRSNLCPLDGKPFEGHYSEWTVSTVEKASRYKAHCWNEGDGCKYVGPIEALVLHYDKECTFHALQCPRCDQRILRRDFAAHYVAGCSKNKTCASAAQSDKQASPSATSEAIKSAVSGFENSLRRGIETIEANICSKMTQQLNAGLKELKALISDPCSDQLSSLQSQMNALVEQVEASDASQLKEIVRLLRNSERKLEKIVGFEKQEIMRDLQRSENNLKDDVKRVEANLSLSLADQRQCLQVVLNYVQQKNRSPESDWLAASAASKEPGKIPWHLEKQLILRKLETFANMSMNTLESLSERIEPWNGQPWISHVDDRTESSTCFMSRVYDIAAPKYIATVTNADKIFELDAAKFASWNQWQCRDLHIKIACSVSKSPKPSFLVRVECVRVAEGPCFPFSELVLAAKDERYEDFVMFEELSGRNECTDCSTNGFPHFIATFAIEKEKLAEDGLINDGKLQLCLLFR